VSSFVTAHQHILGYLVPYNGEKVIKSEPGGEIGVRSELRASGNG